MDRVPDYGSGGCRFESCRGQNVLADFWAMTIIFSVARKVVEDGKRFFFFAAGARRGARSFFAFRAARAHASASNPNAARLLSKEGRQINAYRNPLSRLIPVATCVPIFPRRGVKVVFVVAARPPQTFFLFRGLINRPSTTTA